MWGRGAANFPHADCLVVSLPPNFAYAQDDVSIPAGTHQIEYLRLTETVALWFRDHACCAFDCRF